MTGVKCVPLGVTRSSQFSIMSLCINFRLTGLTI